MRTCKICGKNFVGWDCPSCENDGDIDDFKVGDTVECIDENYFGEYIQIGKRYIIEQIYSNSILIVLDNNQRLNGSKSWFKKVTEEIRQEKIPCNCDMFTVLMVKGCTNPLHY